MKNCILILVIGIILSPIAFAQPPTVIDNSVVNIEFDHDKGGINALTYKYGSNHNILDPYWNQGGLGRLGLLGDPWVDETGSIVINYDIQTDQASFTYENPHYGTKSFDISWSAAGGVEITMTFNFDVADDDREIRGTWEPGGNNDGNDSITVLKADESEQTFHYWYPGPWTLIWEGDAYGTIMWDADYDERIGYRTDCYIHTRFANGASADGPYRRMDQAGTYILYFAVKNSAAFDDWFNGFTNTGEPCTGAENQPPNVYITSPSNNDVFGVCEPFDLFGYAEDPEEGYLECTDLTWSVDGVEVGSGCLITDFHINTLGEHFIMLRGTDSDGLSGTSEISVQIERFCTLQLYESNTSLLIPDNPTAGVEFSPFWENFNCTRDELFTRWIPRTTSTLEEPGPQNWSSEQLNLIDDPDASDGKAISLQVTRPSTEELSLGAQLESIRYFGYGSYYTRMRFSGNAGIVAAAFAYNDLGPKLYTEIDFEILSRLMGCSDGEILCTSWQENDEPRISKSFITPVSGLGTYHEYMFQWLPEKDEYPSSVTFFIDGRVQNHTITDIVPWEATKFLLNIWSGNGFSGLMAAGDFGELVVDSFEYIPYVQDNTMKLVALSPVNLEIMDPIGRVRSLTYSQIPNSIQDELDIDQDGDQDELVIVFGPLFGQYAVIVHPEEGASPDETYSLLAILQDDTTMLAMNQAIADIPSTGYTVSTLDTGSIHGIVSANSVGLLGVPVDLYDSMGTVTASTASDDSGFYQFPGLNNGYYSVSISTPLGYQADAETKQIKVRGLPHEVNFELTELEITPQQRSRGYWAHQLSRALINRPKDYTLNDFSYFSGLINRHFNENQINPVDFYSVPQPADQKDSLKVLKKLLHMSNTVKREPFTKRLAKAQLIALMLNVISGKVSQTHEISSDGRTVSQAITYCDMLVNDEIDPADGLFRYLRASFILGLANLGLTVPSDMIPENVIEIAYKMQNQEDIPGEFSLDQNYPNPFNPETEIKYTIPEDCHVKLCIYNVLGQNVRVLVDEYQSVGHKSVKWDGKDDYNRDVASGIYFYKLQAKQLMKTKKMLLIK